MRAIFGQGKAGSGDGERWSTRIVEAPATNAISLSVYFRNCREPLNAMVRTCKRLTLFIIFRCIVCKREAMRGGVGAASSAFFLGLGRLSFAS